MTRKISEHFIACWLVTKRGIPTHYKMHRRVQCCGILLSFDQMFLNQHDININREEIIGSAKTRNRKAMNKYLWDRQKQDNHLNSRHKAIIKQCYVLRGTADKMRWHICLLHTTLNDKDIAMGLQGTVTTVISRQSPSWTDQGGKTAAR